MTKADTLVLAVEKVERSLLTFTIALTFLYIQIDVDYADECRCTSCQKSADGLTIHGGTHYFYDNPPVLKALRFQRRLRAAKERLRQKEAL